MADEKIMIQISDPWGQKSIPVEWNKLPDDVLSGLRPEDIFTRLSYSNDSDDIVRKTIVYFRVVKRFRKGIKTVESDKLIFGI